VDCAALPPPATFGDHLAEVGVDGLIHDFTFLRFTPGGPAVDAREAVKAGVYKPGACGGVPVPATIYIAYTVRP
jgi:hypothetical protein